jgi:hypothetical protein
MAKSMPTFPNLIKQRYIMQINDKIEVKHLGFIIGQKSVLFVKNLVRKEFYVG